MIKNFVGFLLRNVPRTYLQLISKHLFKLISIFYQGNNVNCPICESNFSKFFPYGRKTRENALCTKCLSLERHRLVFLFLKIKSGIFSKKINLLHIAPEHCLIDTLKKSKNILYTSIDLESPLADIKMDIHKIEFSDETYDFVICNHVLEHVNNDLMVLKEIFRVLKKGGKGIIQVPFFLPIPEKTFEDKNITSKKEREKHFGQSDHVRKYGKDFKNRIESVGFGVSIVKPRDFILDSDIKLYGITDTEEIYFISKS